MDPPGAGVDGFSYSIEGFPYTRHQGYQAWQQMPSAGGGRPDQRAAPAPPGLPRTGCRAGGLEGPTGLVTSSRRPGGLRDEAAPARVARVRTL
jgi:hypothetical protein